MSRRKAAAIARTALFVLVSAWIGISIVPQTAQAHHGHDHGPPPPAPPPPVAPPPPPPPSPAAAPPPTSPFQPPTILPTSLIPTDETGIGGALGRAQGLKRAVESFFDPAAAKAASAGKIQKDARFQFTGQWITFHSESANGETDESSAGADSFDGRVGGQATPQQGKVTHTAVRSRSVEPMFMPTIVSRFYRESDDELLLEAGAVLVKAAGAPLKVRIDLNGQKVSTTIQGGTIALVSAFDEKATVLNLTDCRCGSCVVKVGSAGGGSQRSFEVGIGTVAEVCEGSQCGPCFSAVAYKQSGKHKVSDGLTVHLGKAHYLAALVRFNLASSLPKDDLERVIKTAAAASHVRVGRSY